MIAWALSLAIAAPASAAEYFVVLWSYENGGNRAPQSHTFATFVKVEEGRIRETVDISWLPAPGEFRGIGGRRLPILAEVPGRNYTLQETLSIAARQGLQVRRFGAFAATPELFDRARLRRAELESGRIHYKMLDGRSNPSAINCIHAVAGAVGHLNTGLMRGPDASQAVARFFHATGFLRSMNPVPGVAEALLGQAHGPLGSSGAVFPSTSYPPGPYGAPPSPAATAPFAPAMSRPAPPPPRFGSRLGSRFTHR